MRRGEYYKVDKIITGLLEDAITEIENLQDYYNAQKKYVNKYVKDNIRKYKYGIILDRFFVKKILDLKEIKISELEKKVIDDIVADYSIEPKDGGFIISYKLNPEKDFSGYEMDPQIAKDNFSKLIQYPSILNNSVIMMLLVKYEEAISGIYKYLLEAFPQAYLSDKSITYSELVSYESDIKEIKKRFIDKEIEEFMRCPLSEWYKSFESKQKAKFYYETMEFEKFKEIYYRRNLIVHNQGVINEVYKKNILNSDGEIGEHLEINNEYLKQAFLVTKKILIGTVWGLRKTADDIEELNSYLSEYGYACLKNKKWNLAEYIYSMLLKDEKQRDVAKMCQQVNYWIAVKNEKGIKEIEDSVKKLDVTAMKSQFVVAKYALLDEFEKVSESLESAIINEIPAWCVKEWPLFNQYRKSEQYRKFVEKHEELFETIEYEPNNETIGEKEDIINELGKDIDVTLELDN